MDLQDVFVGWNGTSLVSLMQLQFQLQKKQKYRISKQTNNKQGTV